MHREQVSHVLVSSRRDFVFTASVDGFLKFWRKIPQGIEFVKTFKVNMAPITAMALSAPTEHRLATSCAQEQSIKVFDVENFDLINMIKVNFVPTHLAFVSKATTFAPLLAVAEQDATTLRLLYAEQQLKEKKNEGSQVVLKVLSDLHESAESPVTLIAFNHYLEYVVSFAGGIAEVWDPESGELPSWIEMMSDTDLYELASTKVLAVAFSLHYLAVMGLDKRLRLFNPRSLKLIKTFNESIEAFIEHQTAEGGSTAAEML